MKTNNSRRHPGETNRCRPDKAAHRREEAQTRQAITDALTPQQRLEKLDVKFGVGLGAKKERARLLQLTNNVSTKSNNEIEELANQTLPPEVMQEIEALNEEMGNKKRLKAKDRRAKSHDA